MDGSVAVDLRAPWCGRPFVRRHRARGRTRAQLARCLVTFGPHVDDGISTRQVARGHVAIELATGDLMLDLRRRGKLMLVSGVTWVDVSNVERARRVRYPAPATPPRAPPSDDPDLPLHYDVPPQVLESYRVAGDPPEVDDATRRAMKRDGGPRMAALPLEVCIDTAGTVIEATILRSSGYPDFDARVQRTIRETWRYRGSPSAPYPACGIVNVKRR